MVASERTLEPNTPRPGKRRKSTCMQIILNHTKGREDSQVDSFLGCGPGRLAANEASWRRIVIERGSTLLKLLAPAEREDGCPQAFSRPAGAQTDFGNANLGHRAGPPSLALPQATVRCPCRGNTTPACWPFCRAIAGGTTELPAEAEVLASHSGVT